MARSFLGEGEENGEEQDEHLPQGCHDHLHNTANSDSEMSVEKLDDVMAALTFTATIIMIIIGFVFNL